MQGSLLTNFLKKTFLTLLYLKNIQQIWFKKLKGSSFELQNSFMQYFQIYQILAELLFEQIGI